MSGWQWWILGGLVLLLGLGLFLSSMEEGGGAKERTALIPDTPSIEEGSATRLSQSPPLDAEPGDSESEDEDVGSLASVHSSIEVALSSGDQEQLLTLYMSMIGREETFAQRLKILKSLEEMDDVALAERLILEIVRAEGATQDSLKLTAIAGLALGRTLWAKVPQNAANARSRLLGAENPREQMALMIGLAESADIIGDETVANDLMALYLQSTNPTLKQNALATAVRLEAPKVTYDMASLAIMRPVAGPGDDAEVSAGVRAFEVLHGRMPERKHEIERILVEVAIRPDIGFATFMRTVETLHRLSPESVRNMRGQITMHDERATEFLDRFLESH